MRGRFFNVRAKTQLKHGVGMGKHQRDSFRCQPWRVRMEKCGGCKVYIDRILLNELY
jgi:hypothetical protein